MKLLTTLLLCCLFLTPGRSADLTPETRYDLAKRELYAATKDKERMDALEKLWKLSDELGLKDDHRKYGKAIVALAEKSTGEKLVMDLDTARQKLSEADTDFKRYLALCRLSHLCFLKHQTVDGKRYAEEMVALGIQFEGERRALVMPSIAKVCLSIDHMDEAARYAAECLVLAEKFKEKGGYGACIHRGNWVLGRIAVRAGRTEDAKKHLLASAEVEGSHWAEFFPPNMSLAKDLLEKDEREAVVQYFERCRKVWKLKPDEERKLDDWSAAVKAGRMPDFGVSLVY